jgi:acyl-coenzyme A synthetase/AMP-(fatty) acid ligase
VLEAAVVGRPDPALDEVPVAFVRVGAEADVDPAAAIAHCAGRLADFKVPRAVHPVRELPRSTLSKVDKQALRAVAGPGPAADAARTAAERGWLAAARSDPSGDADT